MIQRRCRPFSCYSGEEFEKKGTGKETLGERRKGMGEKERDGKLSPIVFF